MNKKIVLVQPIAGFWGKLSGKVGLPSALLSISMLLDKEGYEIKIIDQRIEKEWEEILKQELAQKPLFVGVSSMTGTQILNALEVSKVVKKNGGLCVWGGVHASLMPQQTLENENVDIVVQGEGEITLLELAKALNGEMKLSEVKGIFYKENGKIMRNPPREFLDLNILPDVPYHLVDIKKHIVDFEGKKFINFFSSRGCPYGCKFCYNIIYNHRRWRSIEAKTVIERITKLKADFGIEGVWFRDDNFFVDKKRAFEIMKGMKELGLYWGTSGARLDLLGTFDEEMIKAINESNCLFLFIGVESGSDKLLKTIGKDITREKILDVNKRILSRINAKQRVNIMIGLPNETEDDIKQTIDLCYKIMEDNPHALISQYQIYTPYPGTDLYAYSLENGFVEPTKLEDWGNYRFEVSNIPSISKKQKELLRMLAFTTWFMDSKLDIFSNKKFVKLAAIMYKPIADYRIKHLSTFMPIDVKLAQLVGF